LEVAMKHPIALALLGLAALLPACRESTSSVIVGTGIVHRATVECSAWFIHADSGIAFELTRLAPEFQQDGLKVRFALRKRGDLASICMAGPIVDVVSIAKE
jgi:hypothetical protein